MLFQTSFLFASGFCQFTLFIIDRELPHFALFGPDGHFLEVVGGRLSGRQC